jgi:hypothetical protein
MPTMADPAPTEIPPNRKERRRQAAKERQQAKRPGALELRRPGDYRIQGEDRVRNTTDPDSML